MKLAIAIATVTGLRQAAVTHADCDFGSDYTSYNDLSGFCSFDVGVGRITNFEESNTTSSGDTNVTTTTARGNKIAIWKIGDKDSTVQCYPDVSGNTVATSYPNGSTFEVYTGDFTYIVNGTVPDGGALSSLGFYYFQGGHAEYWNDKDETGSSHYTIIDEGDIFDLCEVLELAGDAAPALTPTLPTVEALSSGQLAAVTIIPCFAALLLVLYLFYLFRLWSQLHHFPHRLHASN